MVLVSELVALQVVSLDFVYHWLQLQQAQATPLGSAWPGFRSVQTLNVSTKHVFRKILANGNNLGPQ